MKFPFSREELEALGIYDYGVTTLSKPVSFEHFNDWVARGEHGPLGYLADHRKDLRSDLLNFFPEFQSALVFLFPYAHTRFSREDTPYHVASYVTGFGGADYHYVIKERLQKISDALVARNPKLISKLSLDVHPVLERDLAYRAGLGWFGKNSMFISKELGSFVMIGSLLLSELVEHEERSPSLDHCGHCNACAPACPTDAINPVERTLYASKCISTWTIELFKEASELSGMESASGELFGCDICQDICPWNKRLERSGSYPKTHESSDLSELIFNFFTRRPLVEVREDLLSMSNSAFRKKFHGTPLERTGRLGLLKNVEFWLSKET